MRYPLLCLPVLLQPQSPAGHPLQTRYRKHRRSSGFILQRFVARLACLPHISGGSSPTCLMSNHCGAWRVAPDTESGCILPGMSEKRNSQEEWESKRLESLYRKAADPVLRTHLLMVWRMSVGDSVGDVTEMVGYSRKWTKEIKRRYES